MSEDVHDHALLMKPIVAGPGDHVCLRLLGKIDVDIARKVVEYVG